MEKVFTDQSNSAEFEIEKLVDRFENRTVSDILTQTSPEVQYDIGKMLPQYKDKLHNSVADLYDAGLVEPETGLGINLLFGADEYSAKPEDYRNRRKQQTLVASFSHTFQEDMQKLEGHEQSFLLRDFLGNRQSEKVRSTPRLTHCEAALLTMQNRATIYEGRGTKRTIATQPTVAFMHSMVLSEADRVVRSLYGRDQ